MRRYEVLRVERLFEGFLAVDQATVVVESRDGEMGNPQRRLSVERGDAVAVVLWHVDRAEFVFVRQFRYPTVRHGEPWLIEIAAGKIDEGESPEEAAQREVMEELGFHVDRLQKLGEFFSSPGGLSEKITVFFAEVSDANRPGEGGGIDDEDVELVAFSRQETLDKLSIGDFRDGKTQLGLLWLRGKGPLQGG